MAEYKFRNEYERGVTGRAPAGVTMENDVPFYYLFYHERSGRSVDEGHDISDAVNKVAEPMRTTTLEDDLDVD